MSNVLMSSGHYDLAELLIARGALVNSRESCGNTPLMISARMVSSFHVLLCTILFIQAISVSPLQVYYYSEALPTQHEYCVRVSRRSTTGTASEGLAQGPYMADQK